MIKAVGLDLDDTLYDRKQIYENVYGVMERNVVTTNATFRYFNEIFQQESSEEIQKFAKGLKSELDYKIDRIFSTYEKLGKSITKEQALIFHALYLYYRKHIEIRSEMKKLLNYLQSIDIQLFILTNGAEESQLNKIYKLGIDKYIPKNNFFTSEQIGVAKPDKRAFDVVESVLDLKGNEIIYIGDHYESDILGSLENNWQAIFYNLNHVEIQRNEVIQMQTDKEVYEYVKEYFCNQ